MIVNISLIRRAFPDLFDYMLKYFFCIVYGPWIEKKFINGI